MSESKQVSANNTPISNVAKAQPQKTSSEEHGYNYLRNAMDDYPCGTRILLTIVLWLVWIFFKIFYPWSIEREDYLYEQLKGQGCVMVQNHTSMVEPVAIVLACWRKGIHVRPVYKVEFESVPCAKWLFRRVGAIPVDRGKADMRAIRAAKECLQRGECVLVYPEGTRIKTDNDVPEVHGGFAMMAQMASAPVLPTAVVGAADPNKTRHTLRRMPVFAVGDLLTWDAMVGESRKAKQEAMEEQAMQQVYSLRDNLRSEHPGLW